MDYHPPYHKHDDSSQVRAHYPSSASRHTYGQISSPRAFPEYYRPSSPRVGSFSTPVKLSRSHGSGTLRVRVLRAQLGADSTTKSDVFVKLHVADQTKTTSVKEGSVNPVWNEIFLFKVKTHPHHTHSSCSVAKENICVELFAKDSLNKQGLVDGSTTVDISSLQEGIPKDVTVHLKEGKLMLHVEAVDFGLLAKGPTQQQQQGLNNQQQPQQLWSSGVAHNSSTNNVGGPSSTTTPLLGTTSAAIGTTTRQPTTGTLEVKVEKATNLKDTDRLGRSDPFVTLTLAGNKKSTSVKNNTLDPTWNQTFRFTVRTKQHPSSGVQVCQDKLLVEVMDKDIATKESLGKASLDLADLPKCNPQEIALPLEGSGKLYLTLEALDFGTSTNTIRPSSMGDTPIGNKLDTSVAPADVNTSGIDLHHTPNSPFSPQDPLLGPRTQPMGEPDDYWQKRRVLDDHMQQEERRLRVDMLTRVQKYEGELRQDAECRHQEEVERLQREVEEQRQAWHRELESNFRTRQLERDQWAAERRDFERERREWELERERWARERQAWREEEARDVERRERARAEQERLWEGRMRELEERHTQLSRDIQTLLSEHARLARAYYEERDRRSAGAPPGSMLSERKNDLEQLLDDHRRIYSELKSVQIEKLEKERGEWHGDKQRDLEQIHDEGSKLMEQRMSFIHERETWHKQRDCERAEIENARLTHTAWLQQRDKERQALSAERASLSAEREEWNRQKEADRRALDEAVEAFAHECDGWNRQREVEVNHIEGEKEKLHQQREKLQSKVKDLLGESEHPL